MNLTPAQALENLAQIAADYPLRVRERNVINESIALLAGLIAPKPATEPAQKSETPKS